MWIATATLPDGLAGDLAAGRFAAVSALATADPASCFARGIALANLGRVREARVAFLACSADAALCGAADVEMGFIDLNAPDGASAVATRIAAFVKDQGGQTLLLARAHHLLGVAQYRLMRGGDALDALTLAQKIYRACGCQSGEAQVFDTLGMVHQWMGNETPALVAYAHSLALKTQIGDRYGSAITLGNLGRYCALLGRGAEATGFLELDLQIAREMGDARGQARVLSDLAEIDRDAGALDGAREKLGRALALATDNDLRQLAFEAQLDLATVTPASDAGQHLEEARRIAGASPTEFDRLLLDWTEARLLAASDAPRAITLLAGAAAGFRDADIPALEIEAHLALAELLPAANRRPDAEREVLLALKRCRERNLPRYRVRIGELMERLSLAEGVAEESGKAIDDRPSGTVDGYLIRERLGGGTFATVFRAFDVERAREVALKVLDLESRYAKAERERLLDSARLDMEAANRARHPGLVKVFAIGRDTRGNVYLAIEYIAGKALRDTLDGKPARDPKLVCSLLADVADALAALHAQGVVHRDLKPENIMLRPDGSPVIVDFGIAHIAGLVEKPGSLSRGSPEYFSPEQARGEPSTPADDMYAFGVILWELLKGTRPGPGHVPSRSKPLFGSAAAKTPDELAIDLMNAKGSARPSASDTALALRRFAA